jgi:hypothetical protein
MTRLVRSNLRRRTPRAPFVDFGTYVGCVTDASMSRASVAWRRSALASAMVAALALVGTADSAGAAGATVLATDRGCAAGY